MPFIADSLKTLFTTKWNPANCLGVTPVFCTNDVGHDTTFEMFDANVVTPQVAINAQVPTIISHIIGAITKTIYDINLIVYIKPIKYDAAIIETAEVLFFDIREELNRIIRENRYLMGGITDIQLSGWKFQTKKREEPIIFEAVETVKVVIYQ